MSLSFELENLIPDFDYTLSYVINSQGQLVLTIYFFSDF